MKSMSDEERQAQKLDRDWHDGKVKSKVERIAQVICRSGKFECGQGRCAVMCMDSLGDIRKSPHGCHHATHLYGKLAGAILNELEATDGN